MEPDEGAGMQVRLSWIMKRRVKLCLGFIVIVFFYALAELVNLWLKLPIPASVVGLVALLAFFIVNRGVPAWIRPASNGLLGYLMLFYVPSGVGLMQHMQLLQEQGLEILIILTLSSALALAGTLVWFKREPNSDDA